MSKEKKKKKSDSNWDGWVIFLLITAGLLLVFSLCSTYLFTRITENANLQFNETTGVIGDTFGIMNPFIALIGVLMTFLAFYMQIKANKLQRDQFEESIREDKLLFLRNEKIEAFNSLELLSVSLESIIEDIGEKGEKIKEYEKNLRNKPFESHILKRTPSRDYSRILEINRGSIFKAFRFFADSNNKEFSRLYNLLDFLSEFFQDFYPRVKRFITESFETKMTLRNNILKFLDLNAELIVLYQQNVLIDEVTNPNFMLANEVIATNYEIIEKSFDDDGNPISETNWEEIDEKLLKSFIIKALKLKDDGILDLQFVPIVAFASNIRRDILLLKQRTIEFADEVKVQYDNLFTENVLVPSVNSILKQLDNNLKTYTIFAKQEIKDFFNI